jgi:hypothetical protein
MPQLACSARRACAAVFPKGVLARAHVGKWVPSEDEEQGSTECNLRT